MEELFILYYLVILSMSHRGKELLEKSNDMRNYSPITILIKYCIDYSLISLLLKAADLI